VFDDFSSHKSEVLEFFKSASDELKHSQGSHKGVYVVVDEAQPRTSMTRLPKLQSNDLWWSAAKQLGVNILSPTKHTLRALSSQLSDQAGQSAFPMVDHISLSPSF
jgi:hypothetical protein